MVKIGLRSFDDENLFKNYDAVAKALAAKKPESVKGNNNNKFLINYR